MLTFFRNLNDSELNASGGSVEFGLEAAYTDEAYAHGALPGMGKWIGKWSLKGIKRQKLQEGDVLEGDGSKAIIKVKARLDGNGIVNIEQAQQYEEVLVPVTETKAEEPKKEESKKEEEEKKEEVNESNESMDTSEETAPTAETPKTKKVLRKYDLQITAITSGVTPELLTSWQAAEGEMYAADRLVIDTAEKRNALEEYVYETRSKLEMAWSEFVDDENRTKILKSLNEMEEWLYTEEGENATKSVFVENLNKLRKQGDPIAHRAREAEQRPLAEKAFRDYTNSVFVAATSGDDRYSHLPIEDLDKIVKSAQKKLDWLNEMIGKQNELPKHAPLVITCDDINKEKNALFAIANPILTRPKPKVVPKEEKKDDEMKNAEEKKQEMEVD
jgi:heat shock protein 4